MKMFKQVLCSSALLILGFTGAVALPPVSMTANAPAGISCNATSCSAILSGSYYAFNWIGSGYFEWALAAGGEYNIVGRKGIAGGTGSMSVSVANLPPNSTIYFKMAFDGTGYGSPVKMHWESSVSSFKTPALPPPVCAKINNPCKKVAAGPGAQCCSGLSCVSGKCVEAEPIKPICAGNNSPCLKNAAAPGAQCCSGFYCVAVSTPSSTGRCLAY